MMLAASVGVRRHICSMLEGRVDSHGFNGKDKWMIHIEGAAGELAFAKAVDRYYLPTVNTFKHGGDGVSTIQVRTRSKHHYELMVRRNDDPEKVFVLVTGEMPIFVVRGWLFGKEAMLPEYLKDHGGRPHAYFAPQDKLRPIETIQV